MKTGLLKKLLFTKHKDFYDNWYYYYFVNFGYVQSIRSGIKESLTIVKYFNVKM